MYTVYSNTLMNALHGKRMAFILDNDPEYCWTGRLSVHVQKNCPAITEGMITADSEPYKQPVTKLGAPLESSHRSIQFIPTRPASCTLPYRCC